MKYYYKRHVHLAVPEVINKVKAALAKEGFGVLTEIDVQAVMKAKLNVNHPPYVILGACNPSFAHQALKNEQDIGILLPCNVLVYERYSKTFISTILPTKTMSIVNNHQLQAIAAQIEEKLRRVVDEVAK